jgi:hypothetical protein
MELALAWLLFPIVTQFGVCAVKMVEIWGRSVVMIMIPGVIDQGLKGKVYSPNLAGGRLACCPASLAGSCETRASVFL